MLNYRPNNSRQLYPKTQHLLQLAKLIAISYCIYSGMDAYAAAVNKGLLRRRLRRSDREEDIANHGRGPLLSEDSAQDILRRVVLDAVLEILPLEVRSILTAPQSIGRFSCSDALHGLAVNTEVGFQAVPVFVYVFEGRARCLPQPHSVGREVPLYL